ncbi:UNVERIFIED_CONTAM: NEP1-interacting protein 2 [Sesamum radiatum]|uniref:NEP1-interacting protein 2 n=1 Tax=Sesamum radiatum TaxID=300843 RepID=A0AAW2V6P3_SESRA
MEFYAYPSHSFPSSSPESYSSLGSLVNKIKEFVRRAVSAVIGNVFSAIFTFFFALVGTLLGAMTGALIGQETESGFVRGASVGAISGAVFSIEVFESSLLLWQSDESGLGCLLYLIDVIASLLSGRLVRERIGPAMLSAVQSQMGAVEAPFEEEVPNIFDTGGAKGLSAGGDGPSFATLSPHVSSTLHRYLAGETWGTAVVPLSSPTAIKSELWGSRPRTSTLITTRIPNLRGMSIESGNEQSTASVPTPTSVPVRVAYELLQAGHRFLDVRTTEEFSDGHVVGAVNVPFMSTISLGVTTLNPKFLEQVLSHFGKDDEIIVGCKIGKRSLMASSQLLSAGFTGITDMAGGFDAWVENGLPTTNTK